MRVTVVVVASGADQGDGRPNGVQEPDRIGVPTVMRDLEDIGPQPVGAGHEQRLPGRFDITGQQQAPSAHPQLQDQRMIVHRPARDPARGRSEHRHVERAQPEGLARGDQPQRGAAADGLRVRLMGRDWRPIGERLRRDEQRADVERAQHLGEPS